MSKVLVTGGLGYIGSHTLVVLIEAGYDVVSIDNLANSDLGVIDQIEKITGTRVENFKVDLCDAPDVKTVFDKHPDIMGVIHFAAHKAVGESVEQPLRYYRNNLVSLINVVQEVKTRAIPCLVYSSSCTVYGIPDKLPVTELTPLKPAESPYGQTKQMGEQILLDALKGSRTQGVSLRYFNPAGAHPTAIMGESPVNPALNLVPVITESAAGMRDELVVFGDSYDTRDGTCVRDYIHVMDVARAHKLALEAAVDGKLSHPVETINIGIGQGVTVMEAISAFQKTTGANLNFRIGPARSGDVPSIYADYLKAALLLGWEPQGTIDDIMKTAWDWELKRRGL
jgi:UDP-glucose 4-epimerase